MDPHHRGPEEQDAPGAARPRDDRGPAGSGSGLVPRPAAPAVVPPYGTAVPRNATDPVHPAAAARVTELVAGGYLLTIDPVAGSEVAVAPAERIPDDPRRRGPERAARSRAAFPPPPTGATGPRLPLLERDEECERLVGLLARGRSVRVTGPAGSGRTALLAEVADRCAGLAPDGVIRLSGHRRAPLDLLHALYAVVHDTDGHRPSRARLLEGVRGIGAIVVLDDVEFGGAVLEELLATAGECAFLVSATPHVPSPADGSHLEEVFLTGLSRTGCATLLRRAVGRELTGEEAGWADSLWSASEGLPLRFVQAAAVLRQRTAGAGPAGAAEPLSLTLVKPGGAGGPARPSALTPGATPADLLDLLVAGLSWDARETLRVAAALGGECVDPAHLPALVATEQAEGALDELVACGLVTPVATHHRLAPGVRADCRVRSTGSDTAGYALTAARHYVWWAGHPSVEAGRVAAESDAILAAMSACRDGGHHQAALRLARTTAPVFAAALNWGAWERALRIGLEAARLSGEVGQEAHFHHELGVLALCDGNPQRARTELEASIGMLGVLGDRQGGAAGRRILALAGDRSAASRDAAAPAGSAALVPARGPAPVPAARRSPAARTTGSTPAVRRAAHALPPGATPATVTPAAARSGATHRHRRRPAVIGSRRNLAMAGAGAVIAAVLGTVVTLTAASDNSANGPARNGGTAARDGDAGMPADQPTEASGTSRPPSASQSASRSAAPATPSGAATAKAPVTAGPTPSAGGGRHSGKPKPKPSTPHPSGSGSPSASAAPSPSQSSSPSPSSTPTASTSAPAPTGSASPAPSTTPSGTPTATSTTAP